MCRKILTITNLGFFSKLIENNSFLAIAFQGRGYGSDSVVANTINAIAPALKCSSHVFMHFSWKLRV
jgi:hypothetical protein